jgi:SAM-dependent methyltransferase
MTIENTRQRFYPEVAAGGFSRVDGTVQFYQRVNALLGPNDVVLDIGAGRGRGHVDDPVTYRRGLRNFKGRAAKVIGIDVDEAVLQNPSVDEGRLIRNGIFPLEDASIDLAFSDFTYEHIPDPAQFAAESYRVLKPGGWLCARTPNRYGYISLASRLVPNRFHTAVLQRAQPGRKAEDIFPTHYAMNTRRDIARHFTPDRWENHIYGWESEPAYFGSSVVLWALGGAVLRLLPGAAASTLLIFSRKKTG